MVFRKLGCITDQYGWKSELTKQYLVTAPHTVSTKPAKLLIKYGTWKIPHIVLCYQGFILN